MTSRPADVDKARRGGHRPWWLGAPLLLVIALYILPLSGSPPGTNPNEVVRIELATSLAFWARFDIGPAAEVYGLSEDVSIRNGEIYSDKAPGLSIAAAPLVWIVNPFLDRAPSSDLPAYWPLRHALTLLLVAIPTACLAFLVGSTVPDADPRARAAGAVITALATPLWTYGTIFFGHATAALLVTAAWILLLGRPGSAQPPAPSRAVFGGILVGLAISTEYPTALLGAVIFATLLVRRTPPKVLCAAVAGAAVGTLPALIYHQIAFGAPWITGYSFKAASDMQAIISHGVFGISWPSADALWGIAAGARRGIFFYSPFLVLVPYGLWSMVRRWGWRDAGPVLVAGISYFLFAAGFVDWTAGWCAAARHLVPIIPLVTAVALGAARGLAESRKGAVIVVILIAISGINTVLTIVLTPFFPPQFSLPFVQLVMPSLSEGAALANLLSTATGAAPITVAILVAAVATAALVWATGRLIGTRDMLLPVVYVMTTAVLVPGIWLWSAERSAERELMRAQVLRRVGHSSLADEIEHPLAKPVAPSEE